MFDGVVEQRACNRQVRAGHVVECDRREHLHRDRPDVGDVRPRVAEAHIDLEIEASGSEACVESHPHALVLRVLFDASGLHGLGIEDDPVVLHFEGAHLGEQARQPCRFRRTTPKKDPDPWWAGAFAATKCGRAWRPGG